MTSSVRHLILLAIVALAMSLRVWGLAFDLPFVYHPDEPFNVAIVQSIFKTGDLNPHWFVYPSLFYYINALAYIPYYFGGLLRGAFHARQDIGPLIELAMGVTKATQPSAVLLGRIVTVAFSTGAVALTFLVGTRLFGRFSVAALAALMMAIVPTAVTHARYVTPDSFVIFFATASLLACVLVYQQGRPWHYLVAGLLVGLTASTKYNVALVVATLIAAHFLREGNRGIGDRLLLLAGLCCCAGFLIGTPYALLDARNFFDFLRIDGQHYAGGHPGMEGQPFRWYIAYMLHTGGVLYALSVIEIIRGLATRSKPVMLLSAFPIAYFLFIISFEVRNDRTFLPLTPFLFLLAASFASNAWRTTGEWRRPGAARAAKSALVALVAVGLLQPSAETIAETAKLMHPDGRETARLWIAQHLPSGSKVAFESYSPFVDPGRYVTAPVPRIVDHDPQWYVAEGVRYLVFSQGMYGRYFAEPSRYALERAGYERFFHTFRLVRRFDEQDYEVRIYEVTQDAATKTPRP
jgi:4-amino-4-deoxy-L-arabinose transferase-like glycosyltransferase